MVDAPAFRLQPYWWNAKKHTKKQKTKTENVGFNIDDEKVYLKKGWLSQMENISSDAKISDDFGLDV